LTTTLKLNVILRNGTNLVQSISANADGQPDAASSPTDHIVLYTVTELEVKRVHQATASVDIESTLPYKPTVVSCQHTSVR